MDMLQIIEFEPRYRDFFRLLNEEWLIKYFYIEPIDKTILGDPETYILSKGGYIFFARYHDEIVGTCALINQGEFGYELSKMAVTEKYQGLKIGQKLAEAVIEKAKNIKQAKIFLETNSKLSPAISLYEKLGFKHQKPRFDQSKYERADVYMELEF